MYKVNSFDLQKYGYKFIGNHYEKMVNENNRPVKIIIGLDKKITFEGRQRITRRLFADLIKAGVVKV